MHWDGSYDYEEAITRRLNTGAAMRDAGESYIYYNGGPDNVTLLNAYTLTPAGQRLDVLPANILNQTDGSTGDIYTDGNRKVLIFPGLSPGATEHYHYIIRDIGSYFPGQFFTEESFPVSSTTQSASVTVTAPAAFDLYFQAIGMQGGKLAQAAPGQNKWVYTLHDQPAEPPEAGTIAVTDFSPRLDITSFANFQAVAAAYERNAAVKSAVTPEVQKLADQITQGLIDPRAKAAALYNWVSQNIRYVAINLGYSGYVPASADDTISSGYGDCKAHVALLIALLAAENIPSSGVLVNWGDQFFAPQIAIPQFNHIITYIPQFDLYADSTAQFAVFGELPALERGKPALIVGGPGILAKLVTLPVTLAIPDVATAVTHEVLNADGTITGHTDVQNSGFYEMIDREGYDGMTPGTSATTATLAMQDYGQLGSGDYSTTADPRNLTKNFTFSIRFSLPSYAALPGPGTIPIPFGVPTMLAMYPRHTALPSYSQAVPCLPQDIRQKIFLSLPPNFSFKSLPKNVDYSDAIGSYTARYRASGGVVEVDEQLLTHPAGPTCSPAEHVELRQLSLVLSRSFRATIGY
ncbi:MAG: DUF3857 and transglutaminase domain-containing protein [Acidocella sp.]|nr:DUF3857 and transglutaminase domain-containing protein [Acidocella sp.]